MSHQALKHQYFHEIDSLRALAVIAVIINHIQKSWLPGGFLGVDVFFVISGFVVTSALLNTESTSAKEFFLGFYKKRLKRLYPALLVCLCLCFATTFIVYPDPKSVLKTGFWATLGISNIQLVWAAQDYFATSSEINPFTHTWSLGVEEQFYFIYPVLFYFFCRKVRRGMIPALSLLLAISVSLFFYFKKSDASYAFYLMPSRFWQLGLGGLIFLLPQTSRFQRFNKNWLLLPLGALLFCFFASSVFSFSYTLLATLATAFILIFIKETKARFYLLLKPVLTIGLLSYSLYLYHWPILVLVKNTISIEAPFIFTLSLLLMISTSWTSFKFVESKLRGTHFNNFQTALFASIVVFLWLGKKYSARISELTFVGYKQSGMASRSKCYYDKNSLKKLETDFSYSFAKRFYTTCLTYKPTNEQVKKSIYLYGNSHALEKFPVITKYAEEYDYKLYFMGISASHAFATTPLKLCNGNMALFDCLIDTLKKNADPGSLVVISIPIRTFMHKPHWLMPFQEKLEKITRYFAKKGIAVYLISGYPDLKDSVNPPLCNQPWSTYNPSCDISKAVNIDTVRKTRKVDRTLRSNKSINYISLWQDVEQNLLKQSNPYRFFSDHAHLSIEGAMALYPAIEKRFNRRRVSLHLDSKPSVPLSP
jgi:peptidoglycan/LPS O-acetylase OafA/YrhL